MKSTLFPILLFLGIQLPAGCRCPDVDCPSGEEFLQAWTSVSAGSHIVYLDSTGARMEFTGTSRETSSPYRNKGGKKNWAGCSTEGCRATGEALAASDPSPADPADWSVTTKAVLFTSHHGNLEPPQETKTTLRLLDWTSLVASGTALFPQQLSDSIAYTLTLGAHTYDTVLIQWADTAATTQRIRRVFIARPGGIVGFTDGNTGRTYFLE